MIHFNLLKKTITISLVALFSINMSMKASTFDGIIKKGSDGSLYYCITRCTDPAAELIIPAMLPKLGINFPVKAIGQGVFQNNKHLTNVIFPRDMQEIDDSAFDGCVELKSTNLSELDHISKIGKYAFQNCSKLPDLVIKSQKDIHIGDQAFAFCENLKSVFIEGAQSLDNKVSDLTLGYQSFLECSKLQNASFHVIPTRKGRPTRIDCYKSVFSCNSLTTLIFKADQMVFTECVAGNNFILQTVVLPSKLSCMEGSLLGSFVLQGCPSINNITVTGERPEDNIKFGITINVATAQLDYPASWDVDVSTPLPKPWEQFVHRAAVDNQPY